MTRLENIEKNDPHFVKDLKKSDLHVKKVIKWLKEKGFDAKRKPHGVREKIEDMSKFSDDGDIEVTVDGKKERFEAKQRFLKFSSKKTFPYKTLIVDTAHTWDRANPKPKAYVITNDICSCCFVVKTETFKYWIKKRRWDSKKKRMRTFYECPIEHAKFHKM